MALFVALGGTSYAVATGSIGSREIADNGVRGKDIRNRTITGRDVRRNGLGGVSIKESRLGRVPHARDADRLGGAALSQLRQSCPKGTRLAADACVETSSRPPATYGGAEGSCRGDFRRLATYEELNAILSFDDVRLARGAELTSTAVDGSSDGLARVLAVTNEAGGVQIVDDRASGARAYRCALNPTNSSPGARPPLPR
jgi:hypothetical protein